MRPTRADYSALLEALRAAPYGGATRDFESQTGALNTEKEKATKEKAWASINRPKTDVTRRKRADGERSGRATTGQAGETKKTRGAPSGAKKDVKTDEKKDAGRNADAK